MREKNPNPFLLYSVSPTTAIPYTTYEGEMGKDGRRNGLRRSYNWTNTALPHSHIPNLNHSPSSSHFPPIPSTLLEPAEPAEGLGGNWDWGWGWGGDWKDRKVEMTGRNWGLALIILLGDVYTTRKVEIFDHNGLELRLGRGRRGDSIIQCLRSSNGCSQWHEWSPGLHILKYHSPEHSCPIMSLIFEDGMDLSSRRGGLHWCWKLSPRLCNLKERNYVKNTDSKLTKISCKKLPKSTQIRLIYKIGKAKLIYNGLL